MKNIVSGNRDTSDWSFRRDAFREAIHRISHLQSFRRDAFREAIHGIF